MIVSKLVMTKKNKMFWRYWSLEQLQTHRSGLWAFNFMLSAVGSHRGLGCNMIWFSWCRLTLRRKQRNTKKLLGDEHAYYLDFGDGLTGICIHPTHQIVHTKYVQFVVYWLYLNKSEKENLQNREELQNKFDITHKNKDISPLRSFYNKISSGIIKKKTGC